MDVRNCIHNIFFVKIKHYDDCNLFVLMVDDNENDNDNDNNNLIKIFFNKI